MHPPSVDAYLVYDGGCGVCTFAKRIVMALDWRGRIRPVALQDPESARLLATMGESAHWSSFHFVANGKTASGGDGVLEMLGALPIGGGIPRLAAETPALRDASERLYDLIRTVRDRLACAL